ncbi:RING finger domain-containing protein [Endozoicomonas acroporae]|uniref:RING finger domain-containing protein n=1 Tax=Endozoicomonas acroporae TaxID=1701104 RepID=UPI0013D80B9F|nr:RING finger domain-containing protein [Endozoicomonas acroporae]
MVTDSISTVSCPVCLDNLGEEVADHHAPFTLACGHVFGRSCIIQAGKYDIRCPICREYTVPDEFTTYYARVTTRLSDHLTSLSRPPLWVYEFYHHYVGHLLTAVLILNINNCVASYLNGYRVVDDLARSILLGTVELLHNEDSRNVVITNARNACIGVGFSYLINGAAAIAPGIVGAAANVAPAVIASWLRP